MSFQVDTAAVQKYKADVNILSQQMGSRLRRSVINETQEGEYAYYDRISSTAAVKLNTRHADTPLISTPHDRRRVSLQPYVWADLIDWADKVRTQKDLAGRYLENAVYAMGRAMDDELITAADGSVYYGKTGASSYTFTQDGGNTIDEAYVETGADTDSNLTIGKLRRAKDLIEAAEAHQEGEPLYFWCSSSQITSLLRTTEVTSADYNAVKALVHGEVPTFMGFEFIRTERLSNNSGGTARKCIAFAKNGLLFAGGKEITADIRQRADKNLSNQVYVCGQFGACRMEAAKVVVVECNES